jgi:hypothetical protein
MRATKPDSSALPSSRRPIGEITRGTTAPQRLRRIDRWIEWRFGPLLRRSPAPTVVDLGFGATPTTTLELASRLRRHNPALLVVGIEIDPDRVRRAESYANDQTAFLLGGFEIPTLNSPHIIRALNVLRQYSVGEVAGAWASMQSRLAHNGAIVEGTCDEIGRRAAWIEISQERPISFTIAAHLPSLERPSELAARLPKALIHDNVDGTKIHAFLQECDRAWERSSPLSVYSPRQRWGAMVEQMRGQWPVITPASRARHGELSVDWSAVAP